MCEWFLVKTYWWAIGGEKHSRVDLSKLSRVVCLHERWTLVQVQIPQFFSSSLLLHSDQGTHVEMATVREPSTSCSVFIHREIQRGSRGARTPVAVQQ